jgi:peptidoglycan/LPS O-acetylase OafA/YrhL
MAAATYTDPGAAPGPPGRVPSLDGLRALAICGVFGLHLHSQAFPGGAIGVDLFFVLSAFLITSILLAEGRARGRPSLRAFYWRRVFRLGPALVVWLALLAAPTAALTSGHEAIGWGTAAVVSYSTNYLEAWSASRIVPAYNQAWSLAIEEQFYLVWPFALIALTCGFAARVRGAALALLVACAAAFVLTAPNYFLPTDHLFALSLGCAAAFFVADGAAGPAGRLVRDARAGGIALAGVLALVLTTPFRGPGVVLAGDICAGVLVTHCALRRGSPAVRLLASAPARWIGERSYGVYLYGLTTMHLVGALTGLPGLTAAPIDIAATGGLVAASHRWVETPLQRRGRSWLARGRPALAPAGADSSRGLVGVQRAHRG